MEAKWSSLVSYGMSLEALQDFLPLARSLDVKTVRYDTLKVAKRLESELGEDQARFIEGDPSEWEFFLCLMALSKWALTGDTCAIGGTRSITSRLLSARVC